MADRLDRFGAAGAAARRRPALLRLAALALVCLLLGCASSAPPDDALRLPPESLERRALQTRRFDGIGEAEILAAAAGVLQDLGFVIDESDRRLGLIVASKQRSARSAAQIAAATLFELLVGWHLPTDEQQTIRVSLVTRPANGSVGAGGFLVRVTFQRVVWDSARQVSRAEPLADPALHEGFFERLSQSVFLEAHKI